MKKLPKIKEISHAAIAQKSQADYGELVKRAMDSVKNINESELRVVAFGKVLDALLKTSKQGVGSQTYSQDFPNQESR